MRQAPINRLNEKQADRINKPSKIMSPMFILCLPQLEIVEMPVPPSHDLKLAKSEMSALLDSQTKPKLAPAKTQAETKNGNERLRVY